MDIDKIEMLLKEVSHISKYYEKIAFSSGEKFNIFNILKIESSEVRMHSAILTDLLNPEGSHGQHDLFLNLFVKQFSINDFETKSAFAEAEYYSGPINQDYTRGGRIDILITDKSKKKHIIIENKIFAGDQKNQLIRYHNFAPEAPLFYLNLFGGSPSWLSTDEQKLSKENYRVISYRYDIIKWLEECRKETVSLHMIRETLTQYINLLRILTNLTTMSKFKEDIKGLFVKNPDYIKSIEDCSNVIHTVIIETKQKFDTLFREIYPRKEIYNDNGITFFTNWAEDTQDGVFIDYHIEKDGKNISGSQIGKEYGNLLKSINPGRFKSNNNFIGWFNPNPFFRPMKFEHYDKKEIFNMNADDNYLKRFVENLALQGNQVSGEFVRRIIDYRK